MPPRAATKPARRDPLVSVIVLNYNGKRFLEACIDSLRAQTERRFETILVDNGSSDGSVALVRGRYAKEIAQGTLVIVECAENLGFAEGNNVGVRAARGEFVVLLNNDTQARPDWLEKLLRDFLAGGERTLVAGSLAPDLADESLVMDLYTRQHLTIAMNLCGETLHRPQTRKERETGVMRAFYVAGLALMFRKEEFPEPFDRTYFAYAEDTYLGWLARLRGGEVVLTRNSLLLHYGGGTKKSGSAINRIAVFNGTKNQIMNFLLFYEWKNVVRVAPLFAFTQLAHVLYDPRKLVVKLKAYFWIAANLRMIMRKRSAIQAQREVPDRKILREMTYRFFDDTLVEGRMKRAMVKAVNGLFCAYCAVVFIRTREYFPER